MPCDRDFGIIRRSLKKHDRVYNLHQYTEVIVASARLSRNFTVHEIKTDEIFNFKSWWPKYYKKDTVSDDTKNLSRKARVTFTISKFHHIIHDSSQPGSIKASEFINGWMWHSFFLAQAKVSLNTTLKFPETCAYATNLPLLESKIQHLKILLAYIPEEYKPFYEEIINCKNTKQRKTKKSGKN